MQGFHDIYQRYARDVYRFGLALCGNRAMAEDLAAEAFLRALSSAAPIRQETVRAYLFTITRNLYLQQRKNAARFTTLDEEVHKPYLAMEQDFAQQRLSEQMLAALQALPESQRVALLLRVDDLSYQEIAVVLGIGEAAARVRVHRARYHLSQLLQETKS